MSRYDRLLQLSTFSKEKLELLRSKEVLIIGAGGVGQHVATYLVINGIKNLTIVDFDKVELSNLNRQILLTEKDIGRLKVDVVKKALESRNSEANIKAINEKVTSDNIFSITKNFKIIVDAVDNWETKLLIAKAAKEQNALFLHVGVDGSSGQFCLFKEYSLLDLVDGSIVKEKRDGVMGPMVGLLSSMASLHLLRYLAGENVETDTLFSFNQETNIVSKVKLWLKTL